MEISVIIPFYHGNKQINKTVRAVEIAAKEFRDSCGKTVELIIVNDSPSEKVNVSPDEYSLPIIIIENKCNQGIHQTRINGLQAATGEFVLFLDQDDEIRPNWFLSQYKKIGNNSICVANGCVRYLDGTEELFFKSKKSQQICFDQSSFYCFSNKLTAGIVLIRKQCIPEQWKTDVIKNNGSDDLFLWLLLYSDKRTKITVNDDVVFVRNMTGINFSNDIQKMLKSEREVMHLMRKKAKPILWHMWKRRLDWNEFVITNPGNKMHAIKYPDVVVLLKAYRRKYLF